MSACKSWQEVEERESIFSQFWNGFSLNIIKARKFSSLARAKKATRSIYEKRRHDGKNNKTTTTTTTTTSLDNWVMQEDIELKRFCYVSLEFETNEEFFVPNHHNNIFLWFICLQLIHCCWRHLKMCKFVKWQRNWLA